MFPFNYIPETINPTIRKILISLISIQFIAFVILMITLLYEFCTQKKNNGKINENINKAEDKEKKEEKKTEDKETKEKEE